MIAKYTPAAINLQPGDTFVEIAGGWEQMRGASLVATWLRKNMLREVLTAAFFINSSTPFAFYLEERNPMEAVAQTMTGVNKIGESFHFDFSGNGTPRTLEELQLELAELQTAEMAQKIQRVMAYVRSSGGANMTSQVGVACTIDFAASNPVSFSE